MSKKIEELVEELIDDTKWAELYPNERSQRARNTTRAKLLAEIDDLEVVIEAENEWRDSFVRFSKNAEEDLLLALITLEDGRRANE